MNKNILNKNEQNSTMKNTKNIVRLSENQFHDLIKESINEVLNEIKLPYTVKGGYQEHQEAIHEFIKKMNLIIKELEELNDELWNIKLPSALTSEMDILHFEQKCINDAVRALKFYMKGKEEELMKTH